jgi:hypothetical protein
MQLIRRNRNPSLRVTRQIPNVEKIRVREAREFKGGLNTFDTPLNLSTRFIIECRNLYPDTNGRLRLRYGTSVFADVTGVLDEIIAMEYYNTGIIAVGKNGKIVSINASGVATLRWDATIADNSVAPSGNNSPSGWSTGLTFASFTQFAGDLIICNGVDKPLRMQPNYACTYLYDAGTASNVNVPIAKFCTTCNNYLILANTTTDKTTLYIGMKAVAGTFVGDPGVDNDAVNFVTNTYVNRGSPDITGIAAFRDTLIVSFNETLLAIKLGTYDTSGNHPAHIPDVEDVIENHGSVSHRCLVPLGDDILLLDQAGMAGVQRAALTAKLSPTRESTLIGTDLQQSLAPFTQAQLEQHVFAIHDRIAQHIMFFVPKSDTVAVNTDNNVFVYCFDRALKFNAWAYFDQMAYRCGCRTAEGRIFLAQGVKVFFYHNQYNPLYNDYSIGGTQTWDTGQLWDDNTGWEELSNAVGVPIPYTFATPWSDMRTTGMLKYSKYASVICEGNGTFSLQMFVDDFLQPELSMQFQMTEIPANTNVATRPANNAQLYAWPAKFNSMRLRVTGESNAYIAFVGLQMYYITGSIRR